MSKREMTDSLERPGFFKEVKVVLVGPAKCGKTSLIQRFVNEIFIEHYVPTGFEKYSTKNKIGEYTVEYSIWDTSGSGSYDTVRPLAYQDAQVFILCFSIDDPESLDLTIAKWLPEVKSHCPLTPIILCACKADVRRNSEENLYMNHAIVSREQGSMSCQHIGGVNYLETSSFLGTNICEIFQAAAEVGLGISAICSQNSKVTTKKRKMYSISTSTLSKCTGGGGKNSSSTGSGAGGGTIDKPHIKADIKKSAKNCTIM